MLLRDPNRYHVQLQSRVSCWRPDRLSAIIFPHFCIWSILVFFPIFPSLADAHVVANEVQLFAMATEADALVVGRQRDALDSDLSHQAVVVVFAVGAVLAPCILLVALHGLGQPCVEFLVRAWLVGGHFWAVVPVLNRNGVILLVLGVGDEFFFHRQAHKALGHHHKFVHAVFFK